MKRAALTIAALAAVLSMPAGAQTAPYQVKAREVYQHVISFRSVLGRKQTAPIAAYLMEQLKAGGVPAADMTTLESVGETALIVRLPGKGQARPILFSAHMDVVDARPEEWQRNPFSLIEENGTFYGRGTSDNKAGVTALVSTILRFKADKLQPARDLVFAFVGDEETGMTTTERIVEHPWVRNAEFAINTDAGGGLLDDESGKPLIYLVQRAEKTYATFELTVTNPGGHSSRPRADNAIYQLAHALLKVEALRFPVRSNDLTRDYLGAVGKQQPGAAGEALRKFAADPSDAAAIAAIEKMPEFGGAIRTTCVATLLNAGHAENALPQTAKAAVNCRIFPGVTVESVRDRLAAAIGDPGVKLEALNHPKASPVSEMRPDVMQAIERAVHKDHPGVPVVSYMESGGTDGKVYRTAGIPTFATSGSFSKPSEMFAHGLNERLPVVAFYQGLDHIYRLAVDLGGARPSR